ncbi:hypothetical protein, conserved [Babesia bigemina]|uniref:Uncharacterized protein n=1 Tax=Babesia bigemina TaxID=5866 RepID=A0A061D1D5_BABBI|nr:hypothetical protein, conserved [Babesia bigemina]CDR94448.1 hypothetical protein, conserved [Babesia bigemina]|eukprot:XP_012766634.1 hypothetical protein, conserved [Babesia bigemina]
MSRVKLYFREENTDESTASDVSANDATRRGNDYGTVNSNPVTTQQLVLIHRAYSQFAFYDKRLFDLFFRQMVLLGNKLKPLEIVIIANSMGKSKLHNQAVVDLLCKRVIAQKSGFTMDMIAVFLHGICVPRDNNNNREFFTKIFEAIIENTFEGEINAKHCLTMLQIMTKVKPAQDTCVTFFVNRLLDLRDELSGLETANAVAYITKLDANYAHLSAFVERYIDRYDKDDAIRNAQHLVILFYALSRAEGDTFDKYRNTLLELLHEIPTKYYDPMQVANILRVMATRKIHDVRLLSELSRYVEIKMQTSSRLSRLRCCHAFVNTVCFGCDVNCALH